MITKLLSYKIRQLFSIMVIGTIYRFGVAKLQRKQKYFLGGSNERDIP